MKLNPHVNVIVLALYRRHRDLAEGSDDQRRALTKMIAEQVRFELGPDWGWKAASSTRPPSKDAIAQRQPDGRIYAWDLFNGRSREPIPGGLWHDITDQHFIPVAAVNHLQTTPTPAPSPQPDPTPQPEPSPDRVLDHLDALHQKLEIQAAMLEDLLNGIARLEADNRQPREFAGSAGWLGRISGEISGVE